MALTCVDILTQSQQRNPHNQVTRRRLVIDYAERIFATIRQNRRWKKKAYKERAIGTYLDMSANWLKQLNDKIIKNKDLVTALINLKKEMDLRHLESILALPGVELYSDFKSLRVFLPEEARDRDGLIAEVEQAFARSEEEFHQHLLSEGLVRRRDLELRWFSMGIAGTADEAAFAVRQARLDDVMVFDLFRPENRQKMHKAFAEAKSLYEELLFSLRSLNAWTFVDYTATPEIFLN